MRTCHQATASLLVSAALLSTGCSSSAETAGGRGCETSPCSGDSGVPKDAHAVTLDAARDSRGRDATNDGSFDAVVLDGAGDAFLRDAASDSSLDALERDAHAGDGADNPCRLGAQVVASGSSVTAYEAASVAPGSVCVAQSRTCNDGVLSGTYAFASCVVTTVPAYYISPTGKDTNAGSLSAPFLTLGRAQLAMQASASIKTTYLRAGTYSATAAATASDCYFGMGTAAVNLSAEDDGETWSYYPPDGFASAIIDGGSTSATTGVGCAFAASGAENLTFIGLGIKRVQYAGIWGDNASGLLATDNTVSEQTVAVFNVGAIALHASAGARVTHNYIHDVAYAGVGAWGGGMSNTTIASNVILNSCVAAAQPGGNDQDGGDCGAIYTWDETHASSNVAITNNYIRDVNLSSNGAGDYSGCCATGIYVDDGMSNVTASGNVITGVKSQCFEIHGGNDNSFSGNLCDLGDSQYQRILGYGWDSLDLPMSGNEVSGNIIVGGSSSPGGGYSDDGPPTAPTIKNNAYYNYVGTGIDSSGPNGSDVSPKYEDPAVSCWIPAIPASSPVFAAPVSFPALVGGYGPPGLVIPTSGSAPSWPHGC